MRLQRVVGTRDKCAHDVQIEGKVLAVIGPNESGKTTLLDLITYGIEGPPRVSHPVDHEVALTFNGADVWRRSGPEGDGAHKVDVSVRRDGFADERATKVREADGLIAAHIGTAYRFDAAALFAATPPERRKILAPLIGGALSVAAFREAFHKAGAGFEALPERVKPLVSTNDMANLRRFRDDAGQEWAEAWLKILRDTKNELQRKAEAFRRVVDTNEDRVKAAGAVEGSVGHWHEQVQAAESALVEARRRRDEQRHLAEARQAAEARVLEGTRAMDAFAKAVNTARDELTRIRRELAVLEGDEHTAGSMAAARAREADAALKLAQMERELQEAEARVKLGAKVAAFATLRDILVPVILEYQGQPRRPVYDPLRNVQITDQPDPMEALVALRDAAEHERDAERSAASLLAATRQRHDAGVRRLSDARNEVTRLDQKAVDLTIRQARVFETCNEGEASLTEAREALTAAREALGKIDLPAQWTALEEAVSAAEAGLATAREQHDKVSRYAVLVADRDRALSEARTMAEARADLHQYEKHAETVYATAMRNACEELVKPASAITRAVLGSSVTIDPVMGWDVFLGHFAVEHLSESVTVILGVALRVASIQRARGWRGILIDGMEVIEAERRVKLLRALAQADLDNVIAACVDDGVYPRGEGIQIYRTKRGTA